MDWDAYKMPIINTKISRRHWVSKFESGWFGTGGMMKKWKYRLIDNYPRCNTPNETSTHIIQCPAQSATTQWEKFILEL